MTRAPENRRNRCKMDNPTKYTTIHTLSWLGTSTSIKSDGIKLALWTQTFALSEMMGSCKSFPIWVKCQFSHISCIILIWYHHDFVNRLWILGSIMTRICSVRRNHIPILSLFKDCSQFLFGSWTNNLRLYKPGYPHSGLRKGVYSLIEVISNEPNK